uniref:Uncharacterized protein LOC104219744 n=1 Tax=Nicotiana sylvestris TaxID=4096 RepID=A0A1U7VL97_NICSY|nr:PREDICTED: uncharacterized protein LOC104219744 [Nicotiana sylvestris]
MGVFKGEETGVKRKGFAGGVAVVLGCSSLIFGRARGGKLLVMAGFEEMRKVLLWWLWSSGGKYGKIALPSYEDEGIYWTLGVSRGYLVACCNYKPKKADMWIMKEYGVEKSWTKLVTMSLPVDRRDSVLPLFVTENGDEVLLQLGAEVTQYNSKNASFKRLDDFMSGDFRQVQMTTYFESLASPHI